MARTHRLATVLLALGALALLPAVAEAGVSSEIDRDLSEASDRIDDAIAAAEDDVDPAALEAAVAATLDAIADARDLTRTQKRPRRAKLLRRVATAADENVAEFAESIQWDEDLTKPVMIAAVGSAAALRASIYDTLLRLATKLSGAKRAKTVAAVGRIGSPLDLVTLADAEADQEPGSPFAAAIATQSAAIRGHLDSVLAGLASLR